MPRSVEDPPARQSDVAVHLEDDTDEARQRQDAHEQHIRVKNRRKRWLDLHPEYFTASSLELADPLLYDRLVRHFQSAEEREKEGRERGYTGSLEVDLVRSEAKLEALQHPDPNNPIVYRRAVDGTITATEQDADDRAQTKQQGLERWRDVMRQRFLRGDDDDFDYGSVDMDEQNDDREEEERDRLDEYLGQEDEEFLGAGKPAGETGVQDY